MEPPEESEECKRRRLNGHDLEQTDDSVHHVNKLRAEILQASKGEPRAAQAKKNGERWGRRMQTKATAGQANDTSGQQAENSERNPRDSKPRTASGLHIPISRDRELESEAGREGDSEEARGLEKKAEKAPEKLLLEDHTLCAGNRDSGTKSRFPDTNADSGDNPEEEGDRRGSAKGAADTFLLSHGSGAQTDIPEKKSGESVSQKVQKPEPEKAEPRPEKAEPGPEKTAEEPPEKEPGLGDLADRTFRQYDLACERVKSFYHEQHQKQTVAYNLQARINFKSKTRAKMTVWEGLEKLNKLLDDSDPDTELSQIDHALQTAEAIRRDGQPRWMQLVGLIHDLGKLLYFFDLQGQWDVVGDTFPVGCRFLRRIIFSEAFSSNPDSQNALYSLKFGIYSKNCGLAQVMLSWGHDEYMYHVARSSLTLPPEALAMIRYHLFYPWHQENAYRYLMGEKDHEMLEWVRRFNKYDLYSKADERYCVHDLKPYYLDLIDEYFPQKVVEF